LVGGMVDVMVYVAATRRGRSARATCVLAAASCLPVGKAARGCGRRRWWPVSPN